MRESTIRTYLDPFSILLDKSRIARTILPIIQRAIAEQAVKLLQPFMTGEIFTLSIFKKAM